MWSLTLQLDFFHHSSWGLVIKMLDIEVRELDGVYEKPKQNPALILNADYRPLSYFPLSLLSWQEAIKSVYLGRVNVVAEYEEIVRSEKLSLAMPSVVVLKSFISPKKIVPFTRFNLFLRDTFTCQYCGKKEKELTFDHVLPRSRGGKTRWDNVVAACIGCNIKKSNKAASKAGMKLLKTPIRPSPETLLNNGRKFPPQNVHKTWTDFLYWDIELDG